MIDGGSVSPNLHGQADKSNGGNGSGSSLCCPTTADRDILVYQQLTNLIREGYSRVSDLELFCDRFNNSIYGAQI